MDGGVGEFDGDLPLLASWNRSRRTPGPGEGLRCAGRSRARMVNAALFVHAQALRHRSAAQIVWCDELAAALLKEAGYRCARRSGQPVCGTSIEGFEDLLDQFVGDCRQLIDRNRAEQEQQVEHATGRAWRSRLVGVRHRLAFCRAIADQRPSRRQARRSPYSSRTLAPAARPERPRQPTARSSHRKPQPRDPSSKSVTITLHLPVLPLESLDHWPSLRRLRCSAGVGLGQRDGAAQTGVGRRGRHPVIDVRDCQRPAAGRRRRSPGLLVSGWPMIGRSSQS